MARRRGGGGGGPLGGGGQAGMMKQLQKMQQDMEKARVELEAETIEESVGGGAVTIVITGHQRVQEIKIDPTKIDTDDEEWAEDLQDLILLAVNNAIEKSQVMAAEKMEGVTGGLGNIPGLGGLLG